MYEAQQRNAGGSAGSLSLRLCPHTRPISQTGTAGVILLRMDVVILQQDVHFGFSVCWEHTWARAAETMGVASACFWALKDDTQGSLQFPFWVPSASP